MPLLDHFHPPLSRTHPWRAFHGAWAAATARWLNHGVLPPGYYAVPFVDRDGPVEIDVAALHDPPPAADPAGPAWAADAPTLAVAIDPLGTDAVRVEVRADDDPRLAAAVEIVSPRNKDRESARQAFTAKCVGYLEQGSGLVVVDVVAGRRADLHALLLAALGAEAAATPGGLSATAYRAVTAADVTSLQVWARPLAVGRPLPTLPLWIGPDLAVPLDLEASHAAACGDLRLRPVG